MMKKVIWLPSWYPNRTAPLEGDFIQRMAKATALYCQVYVFFVVQDVDMEQEQELVVREAGNLHETIVYFKKGRLPGRPGAWLHYFSIYKKLLREYIATNGNPHQAHVQVPVKAGLVALWLQRRYGIPYVLTEHYGIYNNEVEDRYENRSFYFRFLTQKIVQRAQVFMPVSNRLGQAVQQLVSQRPFVAIPNTVDTGLFFPAPRTARPVFRFIHVSTMIPLKNTAGIVAACELLYQQRQDFELLLVGPPTASVQEAVAAARLPPPLIRFTGEVSYEQVAAEMQAADALILFSTTENMPCVVLEALCCGLPVIASRVGGVPEVVEAANGIQVASRDIPALARAMQELIKQYDRYDRPAIAAAAAARFSYAAIGAAIAQVYESC